MRPSFNIAGPCVPGEHYMLPPERRLMRVLELIEAHTFFTLNAGRQVGKTTSARWLVQHFNAADTFSAIWVDIQDAQELPEPHIALRLILDDLDRALRRDLPSLPPPSGAARDLEPTQSCLRRYLEDIAQRSSKPLVILFDEADGLVGAAMVSFLTQLRQGYIDRSALPFPASVVLLGQRQVRDYILREEDRRATPWLGTTSPFNITAEAVTLDAFSKDDVTELLLQHTKATGQRFTQTAIARIHQLSAGHPWLTNALAAQVVRNTKSTDSAPDIEITHVDEAKETLIIERHTHIDSLIARLRDPRVRRVLEPMLVGAQIDTDSLDDDLEYVRSLGLVVVTEGRLDIANPIYREVIPRALTYARQIQIATQPRRFVQADGGLDMPEIFREWQTFWRKDGHLAAAGFRYQEAGPHLMLMAFLQRIVNGEGRIEREYGLGSGALDLLVEYGSHRYAIEVKLRRDTETETDALEQVSRYLDHLGLESGWLVLFDLRTTLPWTDKLYQRPETFEGHTIHIVGC